MHGSVPGWPRPWVSGRTLTRNYLKLDFQQGGISLVMNVRVDHQVRSRSLYNQLSISDSKAHTILII